MAASVDDDLLRQGIAALKAGRRAEARAFLAQVLRRDGQNETAWLWLGGAVDTAEEQRRCLLRALEINPHNELAKRALQRLVGEVSSMPANEATAAAPAADSSGQDRQSRLLITAGAVMVAVACILAIVVLAIGGGQEPPDVGPLYETPYVIVYGRTSCSLTRGMMDDLDARGIPYTFKSVDEGSVTRELHPRMTAAGLLDEGTYGLPVVDVSGRLMIRPSISTVVSLYNSP